MSEKHTNIDDAKICEGINLVTGETGANLISFTAQLYGAHDCTIAAQFPEGSFMSKEIRQWFDELSRKEITVPSIILTRSIFVMREAHMLQKQYAYPVRWFYVKADGSYYQADSMDEIGECEQLDEEVMQADRYMDMEMGLKPRTEPR